MDILVKYLEPEYEKFITEKLFLVITGRMHLAVITIPNGVPSIAIAYNGLKAKGSFKHWNIENLILDPVDIGKLNSMVEEVSDNYQTYVEKIKQSKDIVEKFVKRQIL